MFTALAAPQLFSRPLSGVGRIPLGGYAFQSAEFGDVADAVNLASGSVYLDNGVLSRNNLLGPHEDTVTLSGGWHQTPRMRFFGYGPNITPPTGTGLNGQLRMGPGDGDAMRFLYTTDLTGAPSWITRYAPTVNAKFYKVDADPGVQTPEQWLVLVPQSTDPNGNATPSYIAHYYAPDGTRSTFWSNGESVDYTQDLYQQYRSAAASDPEGKASASPKTQFDYVTGTSGRLSQVKDEWGRTNIYTWNADNTLQSLYALVSDPANPSTSWTRKVDFSYVTFNGQQQVAQVTYSGQDGKGGTLSRSIALDYTLSSTGRTLLRTVKRPTFIQSGDSTPAGAGWRPTTYTYDTSDRVTLVQDFGVSDTTYTYGTSSAYGGLKVTVAQSDKSSDYEYNTAGQLRLSRDKDFNPYKTTTAFRVTKYAYYPNSFTAAIVTPAGGTLHFAYDARGNLNRQVTYLTETANPAAGDPGTAVVAYAPPAGFLRQQITAFNGFNQPAQVKTPATSGTVNGASYSYADQNTDTVISTYSTTVAGETFEVPSQSITVVSAGGTEKNRTLQAYDTSGRNTQTKRINAADGQTRLYDYVYHTGETAPAYYPNANGDTGGSKSVKQYGDLIAGLRVGGAPQNDYTVTYDGLGNRVNIIGFASIVKDVTLSGGTPTFTNGGLETRTSYNAFGQQVWNALSHTSTYTGSDFAAIKKSVTNYYPSGEINDSWEGRPDNVTNYRYTFVTSDPNFGRPTSIETGPGTNGAVTTLHSNTLLAYDALGRVNQVNKDGFVTFMTYDTLDRMVRQVLPDNTNNTTTYEANGQVEERTLTETDGRVIGTFNTYDGLGRVLTSTPRLNGALDPARGLLTITSDPYDRPIKVLNDSLVMNAAGDDRATFTRYDEFGKAIKVLGPALRTLAGSAYTDTRRPYQEFTYDGLQRTTSVTTLLNGTVTPANLTLPSGAPTSVQTATYTPYDQVQTLTDAGGYTTTYSYDKLADVVQTTHQVWNGSEPDYANLNTGFTSTTTYAAYDPLQRATKTIDARGNSRSVRYDLLGNTVSRTDERGITTQGYTYTIDGLLEGVYEPDMNPGTPATSFDPANPAGYIKTEHDTYGTRTYPTEVRRANMNTAASVSTGARTSYTYDYAGRPLVQTLPDGSTQTQTYDARGDMVSRTDPTGFKFLYVYDSAGNITSRTQPARTTGSGATTDTNAGLSMGLTTTLTYDAAGGITRRVNNGMISDFESNSLGQTIMATRPHVSSVTTPNRRYNTYRLDGARTAETSYGYAGDLLTAKVSTVGVGNFPSVTSGNVVAYDLDPRGLILREKAAAYYNGSANNGEYDATSIYNGNGTRAKRIFSGSFNMFSTYRTTAGADTGTPNHNTYWKFDQNGNMTQAYDTLPDGSNKQNIYTYTYSPTNQQAGQTRDVAVRMAPTAGGALANMSTGGLLMAGTQGSGTISYNERDMPDTMSSTDAAPAKSATSGSQYSSFGTPVTTTQSLGYFADGHRFMTMLNGQLAKRVDNLDLLGRETTVYDPTSAGGAMNVTTSYAADGATTRTAWKMDNTMAYQESSTPTLGGLIYGTSNSRTGANTTTFSGGAGNPVGMPYVTSGRNAVTYSYDSYGNVATDVRNGTTTTYNFDSNNGLASASNPGSSATYALDGFGRRMSTTGGASDGFKQRYSVEGRLSSMWKTTGTQTQADDFRYDPFGRQALTSQGFMNDATGGSAYQLSRDNNSAVSMLGVPNAITRSSDTYDNASAGSVASTLESLGYSFADGMVDTHTWNLTAPFSSKGNISTLSAPVKPLSEQLKVDPLNIKAPSAIPGAPLDPGDIKAPPPSTPGVGTQSTGVKGTGVLGTTGVQPLQAPRSVLPSTLANPLDVKGTPGVGTLDPTLVKAPETAGAVAVQGITVNPIDTTGSTPTDLTNSYSTDTAQQAASTSYYSSDSQQLATESSNISSMYTASGTDASSYEAPNYSSTLGSSTTDSSYAHEVNASVMQNVQSAFASRGLAYTPDTSVSASEANAAIDSNRGGGFSTIGSVSTGAETNLSEAGYRFDEVYTERNSKMHGGSEGDTVGSSSSGVDSFSKVPGVVKSSNGSYLQFAQDESGGMKASDFTFPRNFKVNPYSDALKGSVTKTQPTSYNSQVNRLTIDLVRPSGGYGSFEPANFLRPSTPSNGGGSISFQELMRSIPRGSPNNFQANSRSPVGFKYTFPENGYTYTVRGHTSDSRSPGYSSNNPVVTVTRTGGVSPINGRPITETLLSNGVWNNGAVPNGIRGARALEMSHIPLFK